MKKYIIALLAITSIAACKSDFTNLSPISNRNIQNFYKTESDFNIAVNGAYDGLQLSGTYGRIYILLNEMRSDNSSNNAGQSGLSATLEEIDQFREIATATEVQTAWSDSYKAIGRCNLILDRIDGAPIGDEVKSRIKGEALFLRSLFYYNLAVIFGNVPLQLSEVLNPTNIDLTQSDATQVLTQVTIDLKEASTLLPTSYTGADVGRATSYAALSLLGKVYLTLNNKAEAAIALKKVVDDQKYRLLDDYSKLWGAGNKNSGESIFEVQYKSGGQGEGSGYMEYFASILGRSGGVGGGNSPLGVTDDVIASYAPGDLRFVKSIYINRPAIPDTTYVMKYISPQITAFDGDNNWVVLRYADVLLMLAEAQGESADSYALINEVRKRTGLANIDGSAPGTFEDKLLAERRSEFAFENQRWQDLLRFGVAKKTMATHLGKAEADIKLLFPIPQREIDVSRGVLNQNAEHIK